MKKIVWHDSIEDCMAAYFGCEPDNLPQEKFEWADGDIIRIWPVSRVLRNRRKAGTWGFCKNKKILHLWVANHATKESIVRMIAHELGHMQRPYYRESQKEEIKAESYADVALMAFEVMDKLTGMEGKGR